MPVAMPTSLRQSYNPTASAGKIHYGPYWPDGTFSPFRPAPLRHDGYAQHSHPYTPPSNAHPSRPANHLVGHNRIASSQISRLHPNDKTGAQFRSFNDRVTSLVHGQTNIDSQTSARLPRAFTFATDSPSNGTFSRRAAALEVKENTFSWGYRAYVELLAYVQNPEHRLGPTSVDPKPAFYPRPPLQRRAHSLDGATPRHVTPNNSMRHNIHNDWQPRGPQQNQQVHRADYVPSANPLSRASAALDVLEEQCRDPAESWLEGKLLAGCLAYGLRHFNRALSWYESILKEDASHVEAMSNMAATLLSLDRKEEALHYWSTAIKLRPSHWEAAEHLVGMLVSMSRPTDAVKIIEYIESSLRIPDEHGAPSAPSSDDESELDSRASSTALSHADYVPEPHDHHNMSSRDRADRGFEKLAAYSIPAKEHGRLLALIHGKGNLKYAQGDNLGAAVAFEDAILLAAGDKKIGVRGLVEKIVNACVSTVDTHAAKRMLESHEPILLSPDRAQQVVQRMFAPSATLPGLRALTSTVAYKAAVSTTSSALLSLAKIYQDGLCTRVQTQSSPSTREILALYYLSMSLQPSPSTANNVGILLAGVQTTSTVQVVPQQDQDRVYHFTGMVPGDGVRLALQYYQYGLSLDGKHAHLYTNLGSLLKDLGQLPAAIKMYETAVSCDENFDIALANLANAVKDQGRVVEAIGYYRRAVKANRNFPEAVCGLATSLNSVCEWYGRGGVYADSGRRDAVHVDTSGAMLPASRTFGWMGDVVQTVRKQLEEGASWGQGVLSPHAIGSLARQLCVAQNRLEQEPLRERLHSVLRRWSSDRWAGARIVRLVERATRQTMWQWYQDRYKSRKEYPSRRYSRPLLPAGLTAPTAPTVLPFHTFTTPLSAKEVRQISQRNALRISVSTLRSSWLPTTVYPPPAPPTQHLRVGYVSSDFNNHPLAHLMQSVFGLHDLSRVKAYCYATTVSDGSIHRRQIETQAPVFRDAASWSAEQLVRQIVDDGIHILVNLNGYTRGARNEVFAARPAPIHMSFMGFAGTLGAEWCDYVYADEISVPPSTLAAQRQNSRIDDKLDLSAQDEDGEDWVYAENLIYSRSSFFCVDHKQSAPDSHTALATITTQQDRDCRWRQEQAKRWSLRRELFPQLPDHAVVFGNFNQLYKIDPATFRMYLRILFAVPNGYLWLLRFPEAGERHLIQFAQLWAGPDVARRIVFTDVAPKSTHITRAAVVDLFLDTPECNAHTTAADTIWSGTPILTWAKREYKMCSRMASSIVSSALPENADGNSARRDLLVSSEAEYEERAIRLGSTLQYDMDGKRPGQARGRLMDLRRILWEGRWTNRLFDTKRWVEDLERAYWQAWSNWESGTGGDIWM